MKIVDTLDQFESSDMIVLHDLQNVPVEVNKKTVEFLLDGERNMRIFGKICGKSSEGTYIMTSLGFIGPFIMEDLDIVNYHTQESPTVH